MAGGLPRSRTLRSLVYSRGVNKVFRFSLAACFWTAAALVFALPSLSDRLDWHVLLASLAHWWSWGALAPAITAIDDRLPGSSQQRLVAHLGIGLVFTVVYAYMSAFVAAAIDVAPWRAIVSTATLVAAWHEMFWSLLVYGLIVGAWEAYRYQQRYVSAELRMERMERNFAAARLNSLRTQLDPHFLFNALNTISAQVEREPRLARNMIEHLGDLLRLSLATHSKPTIPLQEEVAFLDHYLAIQKIRFGGSLRIEINIAPDVRRRWCRACFCNPWWKTQFVTDCLHVPAEVRSCSRRGVRMTSYTSACWMMESDCPSSARRPGPRPVRDAGADCRAAPGGFPVVSQSIPAPEAAQRLRSLSHCAWRVRNACARRGRRSPGAVSASWTFCERTQALRPCSKPLMASLQ